MADVDDSRTTMGLSPRRIADLLGIGVAEAAAGDWPEARTSLLRARFAGPVPVTPGQAEGLAIALGELCRGLLPMGGRSLQDVLLDKETPLDVLVGIKTYAKALSRRAEPQHAVGIAIYYMAIAAALAHHGERITSHGWAYLHDSLKAIEDKWMSPDMRDLVHRAMRVCRKKQKDDRS